MHSLKNKDSRYHTSASMHFSCYSFHYQSLMSYIPWSTPYYDHFNSPTCALISHSGHTLPRDIWFFVQVIVSKDVCGFAHPSKVSFTGVDIIQGHESRVGGKKDYSAWVALEPSMDRSAGAFSQDKTDSRPLETNPIFVNHIVWISNFCLCMC